MQAPARHTPPFFGGTFGLMECLEKRIRDYIQEMRQAHGDVVMGCVRLEAKPHFLGIVYEKPGGSSAQFEVSYDPAQGFSLLTPDGDAVVECDPNRVYDRFTEVIGGIPAERRAAIEEKIAEWRDQGLSGAPPQGDDPLV